MPIYKLYVLACAYILAINSKKDKEDKTNIIYCKIKCLECYNKSDVGNILWKNKQNLKIEPSNTSIIII